jgi:signal transduction histidine kinase
MPRLPLAYQDGELHTIAQTFNRFLDELESFVKREQSLLSLASHELRTPIAVISGALDVLEHRQQLSKDDKATLARVRRASAEMEANVNMLLKMARRDPVVETIKQVALVNVVEQVLDDLDAHHDVQARVSLTASPGITVQADPTLVHMLLRNLIQNALQHTTRGIQIRLETGLVQIVDDGPGLTDEQRAILSGQERIDLGDSPLGGLGLYIVTLMCERLQWRVEVVPSHSSGTLIRVHTAPT